MLPINAAVHSTIALNAVRPHADVMGADLRPLTGRFLTGPLALAASTVAGVMGKVGQVAGLLPDPLAHRQRSMVGFGFENAPGLGGGGLSSPSGGPPIDTSNVPSTPRLDAALAMLQAANANMARDKAALDAANAAIVSGTATQDDFNESAMGIQTIGNDQLVLNAAAAEAKAAQQEANALAAANKKQAAPSPPPFAAPPPPPFVAPPLAAPASKSAFTKALPWLLGAAVVGVGGYYVSEQL